MDPVQLATHGLVGCSSLFVCLDADVRGKGQPGVIRWRLFFAAC
jgi:hypothetical protein